MFYVTLLYLALTTNSPTCGEALKTLINKDNYQPIMAGENEKKEIILFLVDPDNDWIMVNAGTENDKKSACLIMKGDGALMLQPDTSGDNKDNTPSPPSDAKPATSATIGEKSI